MQVSVQDLLKDGPEESQQTGRVKTNYFALKNDGDSAVVRFLHRDINDFDVVDAHEVYINGYARKVSCRRGPNSPKSDCPFCVANTYDEEKGKYAYPLRRRIYIHMLVYTSPSEPVEYVWERSKDYISKLNSFVEDYGDLCNNLFRIVRHGAAGSQETSYDILPLPREKYNPAQFVFAEEKLNYTPALKTVVLDKTANEMDAFLENGNFPLPNRTVQGPVTPRPAQAPAEAHAYVAPAMPESTPMGTVTAVEPTPTVSESTPAVTPARPSFNPMNSFNAIPRRRV